MRLYVPGDWAAIHESVAIGRQRVAAGSGPSTHRFRGHVVTEALRSALPDLDEEELENYVLTEAAQDALRHLRDEGEPRRRLVLVFEVDEVTPVPDSTTGASADGLAVPADVVAWLVDTEDAAEAVSEAASALCSETDGEWQESTRRAVEACLDHQLAWYAATEADEVLGLG